MLGQRLTRCGTPNFLLGGIGIYPPTAQDTEAPNGFSVCVIEVSSGNSSCGKVSMSLKYPASQHQ
jgi:hypothetical protein